MEISTKSSFVFLPYFLFTYLTVFIDDTSFDHARYTRTSAYNGVKVYYLKGVIGLPIVISFRDRWYIFFGNGHTDDIIGSIDSDFRISRALGGILIYSAWQGLKMLLVFHPLTLKFWPFKIVADDILGYVFNLKKVRHDISCTRQTVHFKCQTLFSQNNNNCKKIIECHSPCSVLMLLIAWWFDRWIDGWMEK